MTKQTYIQVSKEVVKMLKELKIVPRESYNDVIKRIMPKYREVNNKKYKDLTIPIQKVMKGGLQEKET